MFTSQLALYPLSLDTFIWKNVWWPFIICSLTKRSMAARAFTFSSMHKIHRFNLTPREAMLSLLGYSKLILILHHPHLSNLKQSQTFCVFLFVCLLVLHYLFLLTKLIISRLNANVAIFPVLNLALPGMLTHTLRAITERPGESIWNGGCTSNFN